MSFSADEMLDWSSSYRTWFVDRLHKQKEYEQEEMEKSKSGSKKSR